MPSREPTNRAPDEWRSYERDTLRHYQGDQVAREYHEQFASRLTTRTVTHVLVARAEQRSVLSLLRRIRNEVGVVADVPCGTGKLIPVLRELALPAVGGDVSGQMLAIARQGAVAAAAPWTFARMDITRLPFPDEAFDAVICLRLLHRVPQEVKVAALREMLRVSRRYAVVSYGVETLWHALRRRVRRLVTPGETIPFPMRRRSIEVLLSGIGWRIVRRMSPLPLLSAEEVALLVKPGRGSE
jgi:SAM-dependent methyltransferase